MRTREEAHVEHPVRSGRGRHIEPGDHVRLDDERFAMRTWRGDPRTIGFALAAPHAGKVIIRPGHAEPLELPDGYRDCPCCGAPLPYTDQDEEVGCRILGTRVRIVRGLYRGESTPAERWRLGRVRMTPEAWKRKHPDFKSTTGGVKQVMALNQRGATTLYPVEIVKANS